MDLKAKLENQEADLVRERDIMDHLRVQFDKTQVGTYQTVQGLEAKVNALTELFVQSSRESKQNHETTAHLSEKYGPILALCYQCANGELRLDSVMGSIKSGFENIPTVVDVERVLNTLEDRVMSR